MQSIQGWSNPLPTAVDTNLNIIFNSLTAWLQNPTFLNGVTIGNGTQPVYDPGGGAQTTPAPTTVVTLNSITQAPSDTSAPGTPTVTAVGGLRSVLAFWPVVQTANGSPVANYVAEVSTDPTFATINQTLNPVGPVASFDNLTPNTAYSVRVAAVSYTGNQGPWSTTVTLTTPQAAAADIAANTIVAGSAIVGTAAISAAQIASLNADKITAGTINAQTIQLGATGGTAALQSTNYVAGTTGWIIKGDGTAEFASVTVDGGVIKVGSTPANGQVVLQDVSGVGQALFTVSGTTIGKVTAGAVAPTLTGINAASNSLIFDNAVPSSVTLVAAHPFKDPPYLQLTSSIFNTTAASATLAAPQISGVSKINLDTSGNINLAPSGGLAEVNGNPIVSTLSGANQTLIQVGTFTATWSASAQTSGTVTLPAAFPTSCDVVLFTAGTITGNTVVSIAVNGKSTTSVSYIARIDTGGSFTGSITCYYLAIGH